MNPIIIRRVMLAVLLTVAITAGVLSYTGIRELALVAGYTPALSWLLPITLDGLVIAGALVVLDAEAKESSKAFGWTLTLTGVAASIAANTSVVEGVVGMLTHAAPPAALALTLEAFLHILRDDVRRTQQSEKEAAEAAEATRLAEARAATRALKASTPALVAKAPKTASRPSLKVNEEDILSSLEAGHSQRAVARILGTDKSTVQRVSDKKKKLQAPASEDPAWEAEKSAGSEAEKVGS